jgi:1,2-phenylacetyl-CoA epoxidase PaaB subunit
MVKTYTVYLKSGEVVTLCAFNTEHALLTARELYIHTQPVRATLTPDWV